MYLDKLFHKVCSKLSYSVVEEYLIHEALSLKISIRAFEENILPVSIVGSFALRVDLR